jgi:hypothetical protein
MSSSLLPFVVSNFGLHGLMTATGIVSNLVAGVSKLPLARVIDVIGRTQGLCIMLFCVIMCKLASSNSNSHTKITDNDFN